MSNKVKVPGGAFYVGDGLTVDPMTRTVSAGGGGAGGGLFKVTITGTANESGDIYTYVSDKTGKEVYDAYMNGLLPYAEVIVDGNVYFNFIPCIYTSEQFGTEFIGVTLQHATNNNGKILVSYFGLQANRNDPSYFAYILNGSVERNCKPSSTMYD